MRGALSDAQVDSGYSHLKGLGGSMVCWGIEPRDQPCSKLSLLYLAWRTLKAKSKESDDKNHMCLLVCGNAEKEPRRDEQRAGVEGRE